MRRIIGFFHNNSRVIDRLTVQFSKNELSNQFNEIKCNRFHIYYENSSISDDPSKVKQIYENSKFISVLIGRAVYNAQTGNQIIDEFSELPRDWNFIVEDILASVKTKKLRIKGEFILLLFDKQEDKIVVIGDHFGFRPFYFQHSYGFLFFGNDMSLLKSVSIESVEMDDRWIADSISTIRSDSSLTPYSNFNKLNPASVLEFKQEVEIWRYWNLEVVDSYNTLSFEESCHLLDAKLKSAIETQLLHSQRIGSELSGGLDSSAITALAYIYSVRQNKQFYAFSHVLAESKIGKEYPFFDERQFSIELAEYIGLDNHIFCTAEEYGIIESLTESLINHAGPTQLGYDIFSDVIYNKAQQNNTDTLLSGFGGDEGLSYNASYYFNELRSSNDWKKFVEESSRNSKYHIIGRSKAFVNYCMSKYLPNSKDYLKALIHKESDWKASKFNSLAIHESFSNRMKIKDKYFIQKNLLTFDNVRDGQLNRIMNNNISQRLEYSFFSAKAKGIKYVYPLLDSELIEIYYSLPSDYKYRYGMGRALFRQILIDVVPETIRLRVDKSVHTIPTVNQRIRNDYTKIEELIMHSSRYNKYHYLDYGRMIGWLNRIYYKKFDDNNPDIPQAFINSLQILLLQKFERNGEFQSGIKI